MNQRSTPRTRTVLRAEIRFNDGMMSAECLVRDISASGARLELSGEVTLPDRFDLHIPKRNLTYRATMRWRKGKEIGVVFEETGSRPPPDPDLVERVSGLEQEVEELKALMRQLAESLAKLS